MFAKFGEKIDATIDEKMNGALKRQYERVMAIKVPLVPTVLIAGSLILTTALISRNCPPVVINIVKG